MKKVLNYNYYKNLGFEKFESWSEHDLAQFLILDLLNGMSNTAANKDMPERFAAIYRSFFEKSSKYQNIFRFFDKILLKIVSFFEDKNKERILFVRSNTSVVFGARKQYSLKFIAWGKLDRWFAIRHLMGYIDTSDLVKHVFYYLKDRKIEHLYMLLKEAEAKLKAIKPNYIVLSNDSLPIERAIILVGKKIGIITMEIQHGIYVQPSLDLVTGKELNSPLYNGQAADNILVWGQYFKDLYIKQGTRKPEDIYVLGYRFPVRRTKKPEKSEKRYTVCYLAQDYEAYNKEFLPIKLETIERLYKACKRLNLKFICRPHPDDDRKMLLEKLPHIVFTPENETLGQTFQKSNILIGFDSTALIEAAMNSKICLQLMSYPIKTDNFEELGVCNKTIKNFEEMEDYLEKIVKSPRLQGFETKFNDYYIRAGHNLNERFLEILQDIKKKKHL